MIQTSPSAGGIVSPDVGVRETTPNQTILMTATPKRGYRFLYWLGDVKDPTRNHTSVMVDSPKMVIAIFERVEYQSPSSSGGGGGGGGGGLVSVPSSRSSGGGGGGGGVSSRSSSRSSESTLPDFYDPDSGGIPEPVSFVLFGSGLLMLRSKRRLLRRS
jgi:hypothetical protein